MANNSYEPYSDSMQDAKQFVSQRSNSTFRSGEGIDMKASYNDNNPEAQSNFN